MLSNIVKSFYCDFTVGDLGKKEKLNYETNMKFRVIPGYKIIHILCKISKIFFLIEYTNCSDNINCSDNT